MKLCVTGDLHYGFNEKTHNKFTKFVNKLNKLDFDILIDTGDLASNRQRQLYRALEILQENITVPIIRVNGNHDYWCDKDEYKMSLFELLEQQREWYRKFGIYYLQDEPFELGDYIFLGYDGWYESIHPPSNDQNRSFSTLCHCQMRERAYQSFRDVMDTDTGDKTVVIATHFSPYYRGGDLWQDMSAPAFMMPELTKKAQIVCFGHCHMETQFIENECVVVNAGSDYNDMKYKMIEIEECPEDVH